MPGSAWARVNRCKRPVNAVALEQMATPTARLTAIAARASPDITVIRWVTVQSGALG
jgi:hypothetical protein